MGSLARRVFAALVCVMAAAGCASGAEPAVPPGGAAGAVAVAAPATPKRTPPPWPVFLPASLPPPEPSAAPAPDPVPGDDGPTPTGGALSGAADAIASLAPYFRRCYNRALLEDPHMKGSVRITGTIGADGTVIDASWGLAEGLSPQVCDCLRRAILAQRFNPPDGGGATVVVPIALLPQQPAASPSP